MTLERKDETMRMSEAQVTNEMDEQAARNNLHMWLATDATDYLRTAVDLVGADRAEEILSEIK